MEIETPERWVEAVQDAVEDCGVPGEIVDLDCTEYPCMAVFRLDLRDRAPEDQQAAEQGFVDALLGCEALHTAFGWAPDDPDRTFAGVPVDLSPAQACPGERVAAVVAFPKRAPVAQGTLPPAANAAIDASILRRIARVHGTWECAGP